MVLPVLVNKLHLLVVVHDKELRRKTLFIYLILALRQSSVICGIVRVVFF